MKEPVVDQEKCIGCGICVNNLPDVFHFNSNGKVQCFDPAGATEMEIQLDAIAVCPVACISWK